MFFLLTNSSVAIINTCLQANLIVLKLDLIINDINFSDSCTKRKNL